MSATVISDPVVVSATETQVAAAVSAVSAAAAAAAAAASATTTTLMAQMEVVFANCDCCGLTEECTPGYIERVRERYDGKWLCGLCAEAVKDEIVRSERLISTEDAMARHMNICKNFVSPGPTTPDPAIRLIAAMRQILRRSLDSPRGIRSTPGSPTKGGAGMRGAALTRSESCFSALSG